ncbi:MAG: MFS transporter [Pseudonocardia sp.]|nr:MFS transporter [Pseudonocardia sp.]
MPKPALTAPSSATPSFARVPYYVVVVAVCFAADVFDGYDLIVYGSAVPALLQYRPWGLTATFVGAIGSYALVGMFFGALSAGALADRFGRKNTMVASLALYSLAMLGTAAASSAAMFGAFRLVAGLGFGAVVPTSVALVVEWAPKNRRNLCSGIMTSGFAVGGIVAALLAILLLRDYGFRLLFALGGLPLVTVVPLAMWLLRESPAYARQRDRSGDREAATSRPLRDLLLGRALVMVLLFGVANFCIGVVVFGLNTWLPQLMSRAGYSLGSALLFQLLLNAGAIAGAVVGSIVADRKGARGVATTFFLLASICICVLGTGLSAAALYVVVLVAGVGATGTQIVLFGYVATHFEVSLRGRALGVTNGFARLGGILGPALGGYLVAARVGLGWDLAVFAAFAVVGAVASFCVPRRSERVIGWRGDGMEPE